MSEPTPDVEVHDQEPDDGHGDDAPEADLTGDPL